MKEEIKTNYVVCSKVRENPYVTTLKLTLVSGQVPNYLAGQYLNIYFPSSLTPEGKAYSLSNAPGGQTLDLTVKAIGEFSNRLVALENGDLVTGSLPYGYFYSESTETDLVLIAAGIGITPFHAMIQEILDKNSERQIKLLYTNRTAADIVFKGDFDKWTRNHENFSVSYFITREEVSGSNLVQGRIDAEILSQTVVRTDIRKTEYMICGGISFTRDMWRLLKGLGINEDRIYTEAFFSH